MLSLVRLADGSAVWQAELGVSVQNAGLAVAGDIAWVVSADGRPGFLRMNASSTPNVASGCSSCGRCPAWLMTANRACGKSAAMACPYPGVTIRSLSPQSTSTGISTRPRRPASPGSCMYGSPANTRMVAMLAARCAACSGGTVAGST